METPIRLLLCEDDENLGSLLAHYLTTYGYAVDLCKDGKQGKEAHAKNNYDLLMLDVMMPIKDGFTLAREIRQKDEKVPIIFLTATVRKSEVDAHGGVLGGYPFLAKPASTAAIVQFIEKHLPV